MFLNKFNFFTSQIMTANTTQRLYSCSVVVRRWRQDGAFPGGAGSSQAGAAGSSLSGRQGQRSFLLKIILS